MHAACATSHHKTAQLQMHRLETSTQRAPKLRMSRFPAQGNRGVNGTATLVRSLSRNGGAQLTNITTPLAGDCDGSTL